MSEAIYLDYAATTPVDEQVAQAMKRCLTRDGLFGNPASRAHAFGWAAEEAVEEARTQVAAVINADPREIVWTSGATESDNLAIRGMVEGHPNKRHIVTSAIEHKAVLDTCAYVAGNGCEVTMLTPDRDGYIAADQVAAACRPDTVLVSIMHANNELGTVNDIAAIGAACRAQGVAFHTDAAQSFGKLPIDVRSQAVDLISISGHKIYGPKGIGALYVRREPPLGLKAQIHGGGHEFGLRSGTLATHQIVGLGAAAELMQALHDDEIVRISSLRDRLAAHLLQLPGTVIHGGAERLPGILNVGFSGVDGETLLLALPDLAVSNGSACMSTSVEPSYVLRAIGVEDDLAHASLRFSVGRYSTTQEVDRAGARVAEVVGGLRS